MRSLLLLALLVSLSGCSLFGDRFRDRAQDYLQAQEQAPTRTPDGRPLPLADRYVIPSLPVTPPRPEHFTVPAPQPLAAEDVTADSVASLSEYRSEHLNPRLEKDGAGTLILRMDGGYAAAWAAVTDAITASSLKLTDLNRSTGTWYLAMTRMASADERGWWARLWGSKEAIQDVYLLKMNRARLGVYLSLLTDEDSLADEALTEQVLNEIKAKLGK